MKVWPFLLCLFLLCYLAAPDYWGNLLASIHYNHSLTTLSAFQANAINDLGNPLYECDIGVPASFQKIISVQRAIAC